jgi:hypothetical protein
MIEGIDEFKQIQYMVERQTAEGANKPPPKTSKIYIKNAGVYKFEAKPGEMQRKSAAGVYDFNPSEFYESRRSK